MTSKGGHSRRRAAWTAFALATLLVLGMAIHALVGFISWAQPRVRALPQRIHTELRQRGSAFVPLDRIPLTLQEAVVATEDQTFWTNIGVSLEGIVRALLVDIARRSFVQGGSTITQELGRDQLLNRRKTLTRKVKGAVLALIITSDFSKRDILDLYLNQVYLGHGAYGIAAAARTYFNRAPSELTPAQCTLLAGLPQAPSGYDPFKHPAAAKERQREVLQAMVSAGYFSPQQAAKVAAAPWDLATGPATGTG